MRRLRRFSLLVLSSVLISALLVTSLPILGASIGPGGSGSATSVVYADDCGGELTGIVVIHSAGAGTVSGVYYGELTSSTTLFVTSINCDIVLRTHYQILWENRDEWGQVVETGFKFQSGFGSPAIPPGRWRVCVRQRGSYNPCSRVFTVGSDGTVVPDKTVVDEPAAKPGQVEAIFVTPQEVTLNLGTTQQFKVTGHDAEGNEVEIEPVWRFTDLESPYAATMGTISKTGLFETKSIGEGVISVIVNNSIVSNKAKVTVRCNPDFPGNLETVLQLYKQKIPEGPVCVAAKKGKLPWQLMMVKPGTANNILTWSVGHGKFFDDWACGSYQHRVLEFLDELKSDPGMCTLLNGFRYGPIECYGGGHQAVVVFPIDTYWEKTGTVLDPWPQQTPRKGIFPASEWHSSTRRPSYFANPNNPWVKEQFYLRKELFGPIAKIEGIEKHFVSGGILCPADVLITNSKGQRVGRLPNGNLIFEFPVITFYNSEKEDGTQDWFFELPKDKYEVEITGTDEGAFRTIIAKDGIIQDYGDQPTTAGAKSYITLDPKIISSPLVLPDGKEILPKIEGIDVSDNDNDEVPDLVDQCLGTSAGVTVDGMGCPAEKTDEHPTATGVTGPPRGTVLTAESRTVAPGGAVQVPIMLDNAQNVGSLGFQLSYDPAVVQVVNVPKGALLAPASFTSNTQQPGLIIFGFATTQAVSGDGSAAIVEFKAVGAQGSSSALTLSQVEATDASGASVSVEMFGGQVTIGQLSQGDINGDNKVSALDALRALRMYVQLEAENLILDMNGNGRVTPEDARLILEMAKPK